MVRRRPEGVRPIRVGDVFETLGETEFGPAGQRGMIIGRSSDEFDNPSEEEWEVRMHNRSTGSLPEASIQRI